MWREVQPSKGTEFNCILHGHEQMEVAMAPRNRGESGKKSINIEISTLQADYNETAWMRMAMAKCQPAALDATNSAYGEYANESLSVF